MSLDNWESGTLTLPNAEVARMREALRNAANAQHAAVLAECLRLWNGPLAKTSSTKLYLERLRNHNVSAGRVSAQVADDAYEVMTRIVSSYTPYGATPVPAPKPRMPRPADVDRKAPRANTRTTVFGRVDGWTIKIDGTKLYYSSGEDNRAVQKAREHPVVAAMFRALDRVAWTRATGGTLNGNDENNQESRERGAGANYITADYGPLGEAARAWHIGMSVEKYRAMMKPQPVRRRF
jgi:hypothetical protein